MGVEPTKNLILNPARLPFRHWSGPAITEGLRGGQRARLPAAASAPAEGQQGAEARVTQPDARPEEDRDHDRGDEGLLRRHMRGRRAAEVGGGEDGPEHRRLGNEAG